MDSKCSNECGVCFESNTSSNNTIIKCESCEIQVHYKCYGINSIQNDFYWYCDVCQFTKNHHTKFAHTLNIQCTLCPNRNSTDVLKQQKNGEWAHIFCSLWNENNYDRIIKSIQTTTSISAPCTICNESYGTTQRCFYPQCNTYYHPLCAKHQKHSQIICKTSLFPRAIFIQLCTKHENSDIDDILRNEQNTKSGVGPIRFENDKEEDEQQESLNISFLSRTNSSLTDEILTESDDDHTAMDLNSSLITTDLSLDEKLQRNDIALGKKEVIELLWKRSAKYHQAVTTNDYLRIAPHDYYNDPLFSTPLKGKTDPFHCTQHRNHNSKQNGYREAAQSMHYRSCNNDDTQQQGFSYRYKDGFASQFHDMIQSEESEDDDEWTLNGIKNKLLNDINNERIDCDASSSQHKEIDTSLNYVTNPSINKLPAPLDDNQISLISHQLGFGSKHSPKTIFSNNKCSDETADDNEAWNGDEANYRVEMDPFGWRWVLKQTEIAPDIAQISCPCLLCTHIVNEYRKRREFVQNKAIDDPLNIKKKADILESRRAQKQRQNVLIASKYGRVLCEYAVDESDENSTIEYKTILNESETENGLQPRMLNKIEMIANQRWSTSYSANCAKINDAASSIYHIDENENVEKKNINSKKGRKRKRDLSTTEECNGFSTRNCNKKRKKDGMHLHAFRELDGDETNDVNNEITHELYEDIVRLYSIMRVNDDRKHMIRTQLRACVGLDCELALKELYEEVIEHAMKHICIWQQIRRHFECGFSDKCGIFHHTHSRSRYDDDNDVSVCCVCFDGTFTDSNPIIFCDCCNIGVHRYCYGLKKIPKENAEWLCVACKYSKSNSNLNEMLVARAPQCCLCPIKGGALKRTKEGRFAHITCSMWIEGIEIGDIARMSPILNVANVTNVNNNNNNNGDSSSSKHNIYEYLNELQPNQCIICGENKGGFISCAHDECKSSFHVLCAWFNGQYMRIYLDDDDDGLKYNAFCWQHTPENVGGAKDRNFDKFRQLRKQGLTENKLIAQIHRRERILNALIAQSIDEEDEDDDLHNICDQYLAEQCAVCFEEENRENNLVSCRICGVYVHFNCYGLDPRRTKEEEEEWLCDVCSLSRDDLNLESVQCVLCPRKGGALKMADNKYWVHLACVRYSTKVSVDQLLSKCDENQCYLCHSCDGFTIECQHAECNLYFHVLCSLFCTNAAPPKYCRKHCAILQIKGGIHHMYQNVKLLKLRKTYRMIQCLLYLLQQRQFRNKCLIENVENEITKMLPKSSSSRNNDVPSTPASQLIVNHCDENDEEKQVLDKEEKYERYCDVEKKYKYKIAMMQALATSIQLNDDEIENNHNLNLEIEAINTLPNYTHAAMDALNTMYHENVSAAGSTPHMNDAEAANKLISYAKYMEHQTSQIFNNNNNNNDNNNLDLDYAIKIKYLKEKLKQMDAIYFNQMCQEIKSKHNINNNNDDAVEKEEEKEEEKEQILIAIDSETGNKMKYCALCGRERGKGWSISVWLKHLNNKHIHECHQCAFRTTKTNYLKDHYLNTHS